MNKKNYKIESVNIRQGIYYVKEIDTDKIVCAANHKKCGYIATRLNESNDDLQTIINELNSGTEKWKEVPKEIYNLRSLKRKMH